MELKESWVETDVGLHARKHVGFRINPQELGVPAHNVSIRKS
jgi:hypothetical protein